MSFQYVFGNPLKGKPKKKPVAKRKNTHKLDNKKEFSMTKKKSAKFKAFLASKGKLHKKSKHKKKRNPAYVGSKNGEAKKVSVVYPSKSEMSAMNAKFVKAKKHSKKHPKDKTSKKVASAALRKLRQGAKGKKTAQKEAAQMKKQGLDVTFIDGSFSETASKLKGIQMAKKKSKKRKSTKKRKMTKKQLKYFGKKKKTSKKRKTHKKRKSHKKTKSHKRSHKKTIRRSKKRVHKKTRKHSRRKVSRKSKKSYFSKMRKGSVKKIKRGKRKYVLVRTNPKKRLNPIGGIMSQFEKYTGHSIQEAGGLALGGLAYGAVNSLMAKVPGVNKVQSMLVKVPVIGTSLPTLLLGAVLNAIGEKKKIKALQIAGSGLVGASIVGMGVNASQLIPGLKSAALSGVDYTMNGVDYTQMNGVTAYMDGHQQLGSDADFGTLGSDADFGEVPSGFGNEPDFGEDGMEGIPSGLGHEGQLG